MTFVREYIKSMFSIHRTVRPVDSVLFLSGLTNHKPIQLWGSTAVYNLHEFAFQIQIHPVCVNDTIWYDTIMFNVCIFSFCPTVANSLNCKLLQHRVVCNAAACLHRLWSRVHSSVCANERPCISQCNSPSTHLRLYVPAMSPVYMDGFSPNFCHWCILGQRWTDWVLGSKDQRSRSHYHGGGVQHSVLPSSSAFMLLSVYSWLRNKNLKCVLKSCLWCILLQH